MHPTPSVRAAWRLPGTPPASTASNRLWNPRNVYRERALELAATEQTSAESTVPPLGSPGNCGDPTGLMSARQVVDRPIEE